MKRILSKIILLCLMINLFFPTVVIAEKEYQGHFVPLQTSEYFSGKTNEDIHAIYTDTESRSRLAVLLYYDYCDADEDFKNANPSSHGLMIGNNMDTYLGWGYYSESVVVCGLYVPGVDDVIYVKWTGTKNEMDTNFNRFFVNNCTEYTVIDQIDEMNARHYFLSKKLNFGK